MTRFRVLVADDEPLARTMVAALLREDQEIETVLECGDASAARTLIADQRPDIVFLDIEMPELSGMDLAAELGDAGPVVVFVTAFNRYATEAFEVEASDYVLKPFTDERFADAVNRAKRRVRSRRLGELANQLATLSSEMRPAAELSKSPGAGYLKRLAFRHNDRSIALGTSDIVWIEAEDYYVRVHSRQGRHMVRASMASLEERLDPRSFLRVHRAALVNVDEVRELKDDGMLSLVLSDGTIVPVSRSKRASVEAALMPRLRSR